MIEELPRAKAADLAAMLSTKGFQVRSRSLLAPKGGWNLYYFFMGISLSACGRLRVSGFHVPWKLKELDSCSFMSCVFPLCFSNGARISRVLVYV